MQHHHTLPYIFPPHSFQRKAGALARTARGHLDALALDGADGGGGEIAERVRADEDGVAGVDDAALDDAADDGADEGDGEGVVDVEFEGPVGIVVAVVGEDVEEGADEIEGLAGDIGDLEDGADAAGDELCLGIESTWLSFGDGRDRDCDNVRRFQRNLRDSG